MRQETGNARRVGANFNDPNATLFRRTSPTYISASGKFDAAFEWFDRVVEERDQNMMPILSCAHFDPIRQDPRFTALLRKMQLA